MEVLELLSITTQYATIKFQIFDGMVHAKFGGRSPEAVAVSLPPREFYEAWIADRPKLRVSMATHSIRHADETAPKGYRWETLERFDKTPAEIVTESQRIDLPSEPFDYGRTKFDRIDTMQDGAIFVSIGGRRVRWDDLKALVEG